MSRNAFYTGEVIGNVAFNWVGSRDDVVFLPKKRTTQKREPCCMEDYTGWIESTVVNVVGLI